MNLEMYSTKELSTNEMKDISGGSILGIMFAVFIIGILVGAATAN